MIFLLRNTEIQQQNGPKQTVYSQETFNGGWIGGGRIAVFGLSLVENTEFSKVLSNIGAHGNAYRHRSNPAAKPSDTECPLECYKLDWSTAEQL